MIGSVQYELFYLDLLLWTSSALPLPSRAAAVWAVIRPEHGVGQQLVVGRPRAPLVAFALRPESPELGPALEDRCVPGSGRVCPVPHQPQSGQLGP